MGLFGSTIYGAQSFRRRKTKINSFSPLLTTFMMDFSQAMELPSNCVHKLSWAGVRAVRTAWRHNIKPGGTSSVLSITAVSTLVSPCSMSPPPVLLSSNLSDVRASGVFSVPKFDKFRCTLQSRCECEVWQMMFGLEISEVKHRK